MEIVIIIDHWDSHQTIATADIIWIIGNKRKVYDYLLLYPHRDFSIGLLSALIYLRKTQESDIGIEDIMFGCLLVTIHRQIEDCLLLWKAKNTDFDTFCGLDIQLIPFMGVPATVTYLQTSHDPDATKALEYILECNENGDFDELDNYYSAINLY